MRYQYRTQGTCSSLIEFEIDENNIVRNVMFIGGCSGNTQGVSRLVEGMTTEQVIERLRVFPAKENLPVVPTNWQRQSSQQSNNRKDKAL